MYLMNPHSLTSLVVIASLVGCGSDSTQALIQSTNPLNGTTSVERTIKPTITFIDGAAVDLLPSQAAKVVLFDITGGARQTVVGSVLANGETITYEPSVSELAAGHQFELVIKEEWCQTASTCTRPTVAHEEASQSDSSEWPEEPMTWPYKLRFSTKSAPRVRAAYLDGGGIHLRFSQPMNPAMTQDQIKVTDIASTVIKLSNPVWADGQKSLRLDLGVELGATSVYTLTVNRAAIGEDGTLLDGDEDGKPGESSDSFSVKFTGSQQIIRSRLGD
jgi:Bacterial Ig-like domain